MCRQIETLWHQTSLFFSLRVGIGIPRADCLIVCPICFLPFGFGFPPFVGLVSIVFLDDLPLLTFVSFLSIRPQIKIPSSSLLWPSNLKGHVGPQISVRRWVLSNNYVSCLICLSTSSSTGRHISPLFHSLLVRPSSAMMATGPPHIGLRNFVWFQFILFPLLAVNFWKKKRMSNSPLSPTDCCWCCCWLARWASSWWWWTQTGGSWVQVRLRQMTAAAPTSL